MSTVLPVADTTVRIRDAAGRLWESRVETSGPDGVTVGRPLDLPSEGAPALGDTIEISWHTDGASYQLPTELVGTGRDGRVALWVLAPRGEALRLQRRAHFRVSYAAQVVLGVPQKLVIGHLVDVSEAAVRCRISPEDVPVVEDGTSLTVTFSIRETRFELAGTVLRNWSTERPSGESALDVVVMLDVTEAQAMALRRALLAEQVRQRRVGS